MSQFLVDAHWVTWQDLTNRKAAKTLLGFKTGYEKNLKMVVNAFCYYVLGVKEIWNHAENIGAPLLLHGKVLEQIRVLTVQKLNPYVHTTNLQRLKQIAHALTKIYTSNVHLPTPKRY